MIERPSVWLTAQSTSRKQRARRYLPESMSHPGKMLPAVAREAIAAFTDPGDVVADPMCGIGTTLVEAVHLGRDAFGVEYEAEWAVLARMNVEHARDQGATGTADVVVGDCRYFRSLIPEELVGQVALVLTSPPYGPSVHGHTRTTPNGVVKKNARYSADRTNLAYIGEDRLAGAVGEMLREVHHVLRPGGHLVCTTRPWRRDGVLIDFPGQVIRAAEGRGLVLAERDVALLAAVRDDRLVPRASFFHLQEARRAAANGRPQLVIAHEDVLVFRREH